MDEIRELDVVALMTDLPEENLLRGQVGTVVMDLPPDAAEVEFVDQQGKTYAMVSIPKSQLLRLRHEPIKAA